MAEIAENIVVGIGRDGRIEAHAIPGVKLSGEDGDVAAAEYV